MRDDKLLINTPASNNFEDMSNKQIEELATEIYTLFRSHTMSRALARRLYDKGYRKQSEGEWETILRYPRREMLNAYSHICKAEGCGYFYKDIRPNGYKFCPNCGAKMKGGN